MPLKEKYSIIFTIMTPEIGRGDNSAKVESLERSNCEINFDPLYFSIAEETKMTLVQILRMRVEQF
jgi:hypothetical protein